MINQNARQMTNPQRDWDMAQEFRSVSTPYKLLIVDDSKFMRRAIREIFDADESIEIVGEASNGRQAIEMLSKIHADVITLDVEMPEMDGLTTLKHMMVENPVPAVMLSTLTHEGTTVTFDALRYGAVDFIPKPSRVAGKELEKQAGEIIRKVKLAAAVNIHSVRYIRALKKQQSESCQSSKCSHIVAIGAGEGGYSALLKIIPALPADFPGACIVVLHADEIHVDAFIRYLDMYSAMKIRRACDGEPVEGGVCYIGPGMEYLTVRSLKSGPVMHANPSPFKSRRGSVNMLMFSVAEVMNTSSVGLILSGSGTDGNEGMAEIVRVDGSAIVQTPKSCMYNEMVTAALENNGHNLISADPKQIADMLCTIVGFEKLGRRVS